MKEHRAVVSRDHRGRGREVIGVDWTQAHHERGPRIYGVKRRMTMSIGAGLFQTVVTAVVANRELVDGWRWKCNSRTLRKRKWSIW